MFFINSGNDAIVADITIPLSNASNLLSAFTRCVRRFREINGNLDEITNNLLSRVYEFITTQSIKFLPPSSARDNINESQTRTASNEVSTKPSISIDHEPQENAINELHSELDDQIREERLDERIRSVVEPNGHKPLDKQTM